MTVILPMTNLSALVPGLIAMYIYVYMIIVDLGKERQWFDTASLEVTPSVWHLRTFPPQLVVGMLPGIKKKKGCLPLLS